MGQQPQSFTPPPITFDDSQAGGFGGSIGQGLLSPAGGAGTDLQKVEKPPVSENQLRTLATAANLAQGGVSGIAGGEPFSSALSSLVFDEPATSAGATAGGLIGTAVMPGIGTGIGTLFGGILGGIFGGGQGYKDPSKGSFNIMSDTDVQASEAWKKDIPKIYEEDLPDYQVDRRGWVENKDYVVVSGPKDPEAYGVPLSQQPSFIPKGTYRSGDSALGPIRLKVGLFQGGSEVEKYLDTMRDTMISRDNAIAQGLSPDQLKVAQEAAKSFSSSSSLMNMDPETVMAAREAHINNAISAM